MFTYDQPDKLYWPGGLDSDRFNEIVKRAKSGDKLALAAVAELKSTGAYNKAASQKAKKDPEEKYMVHGDSSPDPKLVDITKRRLGDIKAAADKGDADAKEKWATSNTNYTNKKALAAKGDPKATAIVAVLEATGLFKS